MKNVALLSIIVGVIALAIAVIVRLMNLQPLLNNPVTGMWKVCVALLLLAIAIGTNK